LHAPFGDIVAEQLGRRTVEATMLLDPIGVLEMTKESCQQMMLVVSADDSDWEAFNEYRFMHT
jgi:hypothetical protein